jgi:endo-1,4-beta-mannosidase
MEKEMPKNFLKDIGSEHVDQGGDSRQQEPYAKRSISDFKTIRIHRMNQ